jgi:hypothetical protein
VIAAQLQIAPTRTEIVSSRTALTKMCGSHAWIYGCTRFLGEKLTTSCANDNGLWQLRVTAQYIPYMYLWQPESIGHEKLHMDDIRESVDLHLRDLEARSYSIEESCVTAGRLAAENFPRRMNEWKKASNAKRHPSGRDASEARRRR